MLKKTLVAVALTAASGAALANPPHWAPAHGYRAHHYQPQVRYYPVVQGPVYVAPRPVYVARPVYVSPRPVYVAPAPVVYAPHPDAGAILFGALLGGVIAHQIVTR
jgi:hypothetical protein